MTTTHGATALAERPASSDVPAVRADNLVHIYGAAGAEVVALRGVDLRIDAGETVALLGPSGSGKSTLLWLLGGLLRPTAGALALHGRSLGELDQGELAELRAREVGIVLQTPARNLLPYATAAENVIFAQRPTRRTGRMKRRRAHALLDAVGLAGVAGRASGALSGGEQQRLALALALANGPKVLLADEPTSQLDHASADAVLDLLAAANAELGTTVLVVTHDETVGARLGRTLTIRDGRIGAEGRKGEEYVVVGRDGGVQLPPETSEALPAGSLARVVVRENSVELVRVDPEHADAEPGGAEAAPEAGAKGETP
jgi:ABC-type lipoprotein export system ATPase subunit